jgi:hypothetical protein
VIVPVAMFIMFLAIQSAIWVDAAELLQASAAVGSEVAAGSGGSSAAGEQAAVSFLRAHEPDLDGTTKVTVDQTPNGLAEVQVTGVLPAIVPVMAIRVSATRTVPLQEFRASG